jgi:hypothetical protein
VLGEDKEAVNGIAVVEAGTKSEDIEGGTNSKDVEAGLGSDVVGLPETVVPWKVAPGITGAVTL